MKNSTKLTLIAAVAVMMLTTTTVIPKAEARPHGKRLEKIANELGVDAATKKQIKQMIEQSRAETKVLRTRMKQERRKLRELMKQDAPPEAAVLAQVEVIGQLKTNMKKLRIKTMLRMRQLLTPQQRKALRQLRDQRREKHLAACQSDVQKHCASVKGRRKGRCLMANFDKLSQSCRTAMAKKMRRHGRAK